MRILVVDDNPNALRILGALLTLENHTVVLAATPGAALEAASQPFDAMLVDINLPGMSGLQVANEIRNKPLHAKTVIAAVSAHAHPSEEKLREHGVDLYLAKPVDMQSLLRTLERAQPR